MRKKKSSVFYFISAGYLTLLLFVSISCMACSKQESDLKTEIEAKKIFQTIRVQTNTTPSGKMQLNRSAMLQAEKQLAQLGEGIIPILCKAAQSRDDLKKLVALNTIPFLLANRDIEERNIIPLLEIAYENRYSRNMALVYIEQIQYSKDRHLLLRSLKRYLDDDDVFNQVIAQRIIDHIDEDLEEKFHVQTILKNPEIVELLKNLTSDNQDMNEWKPILIRNPETKRMAVVPQVIIRKLGLDRSEAQPIYIEAAVSLAEAKDPLVESDLIDILRNGSSPHRCAAAYTLSLRENLSDKAIEELIRALSGSPEELIAFASMALAQSGEMASSAINPLIDVLSSPSSDEVRIAAILALGEIGITSTLVISSLETASKAPNSQSVKLIARTTLEQLTEKDK